MEKEIKYRIGIILRILLVAGVFTVLLMHEIKQNRNIKQLANIALENRNAINKSIEMIDKQMQVQIKTVDVLDSLTKK